MKTILQIMIFLLLGTTFAQQGINYKALIKDGSGNVVANDLIQVQFTILQGTAQTSVYEETHSPTTDANGIVILNIGEGTPISGTFSTIDWAADDHYLNVQINTGGGLTDMGTTQFMAVPYAMHAQTSANVSGLEALDESNGIGWRLIGRDPAFHDDIGYNAVDLTYSSDSVGNYGATGEGSFATGFATLAGGDYSTAIGAVTKALGNYSTAMGVNTEASGSISTAMGSNTTASGQTSIAIGSNTTASEENSIAIGRNSNASGISSMAMGYNVTASGWFTTAMGYGTKAEAYGSMALGQYNFGGGNTNSWIATDPLFEIGNGTSNTTRKNALTILKNGNVGITTNTPATKLHISGGTDASYDNTSGYLVIGDINGLSMVMDSNEIMARNNGAASPLYLQNEGGNVYVGGAIINSSDRRLKRDIETLQYGLKEVLQLSPKQYYWKNRGEQTHKSLGLIAQEVQHIISELVHTVNDENNTLSVSYTELIPVLINAIQEQQQIIENQKQTIKGQSTVLQSLLERMEVLETKIENKYIITKSVTSKLSQH